MVQSPRFKEKNSVLMFNFTERNQIERCPRQKRRKPETWFILFTFLQFYVITCIKTTSVRYKLICLVIAYIFKYYNLCKSEVDIHKMRERMVYASF